jgi:hypothetical protein
MNKSKIWRLRRPPKTQNLKFKWDIKGNKQVANKIDELYLTLSKISGGENVYDLSALTREFTVESSEKIDGETFLKLIRN